MTSSPGNDAGNDKNTPLIKSLQDLTIIEAMDSEGKLKSTTFYHVTEEEEVYYGQTPKNKNKRETTIAEYNAALQRVPDEDIYPRVPEDIQLTIAPETLDASTVYVKRPGLQWYDDMIGTDFLPKTVLDETVVMEKISQSPHPNIIQYYGCRVKRGYITSIVLERLDQTLHDYVSTPEFQDLDTDKFCRSMRSAVEYLHSLGLAHNDINPYNIMLKKESREPVLIDFDSCQPVGERLQSLGTEGWYEKQFFTSEKDHDVYALKKLGEWLGEQNTGAK
ncbi:Protein kinase-like [Aspergillus mulundensis]|uniref:Protein kinase-like n=1 Tax=Aspergillus mulundensis TaxID=1810919 RepID=A0A3D8RR97_9EURO|nr:Protein kinase-like [Aspergillus mulundensis]RDW76579.1 Protein kinase-like [Aspergillus mulundensis]